MKAARLIPAILLPFLASAEPPATAPRPATELRQLLQEGLFEEEANRNLDKAAAAYEALVQSFDKDRQYAATAVFRLAEIRAKQNRNDEAIALFQRVITEFANVDPLARLSRERIAALGGKAPAAAMPGESVSDEEGREIARLQELVKNSPDLLNSAVDGSTPLGRAAQKGWLKAAAFLLDRGADINAPRDGYPPLHLAATDGRKAMVELLVKRGADVNLRDQAQRTPLQVAADFLRTEVARVLLENGADPNLRTDPSHGQKGRSPLHTACTKGDLAMVRLLLDKGADVNLVSLEAGPLYDDKVIGTPLMVAVRSHNKEVAEFLLDHKADPNTEVGRDDFTALSVTVSQADVAMAGLLFERGAKPKPAGLVYAAADRNELEMIQLLAKNGADMNAKNPAAERITPLYLAVTRSKKLTETLLESGASPNVSNESGLTPLHQCLFGYPGWNPTVQSAPPRSEPAPDPFEICQLLVAKGADINARTKSGVTPLRIISAERNAPFPVIEWFLSHGADPNVKAEDGSTPITAAPMDRRLWLEEHTLYSQWVKERAIHGVVRISSYSSDAPSKIMPGAEFDTPPDAANVAIQALNRQNPSLSRCDLLVYRAGPDGRATEAARIRIGESDGPKELPRLQWGDVVLLYEPPQSNNPPMPTLAGNPPRAIRVLYPLFSLENELNKYERKLRTISVQVGDRQSSVQLFGSAPWEAWAPVTDPVPEWGFSELISHLVEAEPRAQLAAIKVQRTVEGKPKEWSVDLRPDKNDGLVKSLPARLADGDRVVISLSSVDDPEALKARRSGIFRAAPDRVFGERVFRLSEKDNAPRTLGDLIAEAYDTSPMIVPNPDFSRVQIHRLKADSSAEETIEVNLDVAKSGITTDTPDEEARKLDVPLQWGDIVEIAPRKELDPEKWGGLGGLTTVYLKKALSRNVSIQQRGYQTRSLPLAPGSFGEFKRAKTSFEGNRWVAHLKPKGIFGALRALSDEKNLLKVRIQSRGTVREFTPDELKAVNPWLLDGDVIEIESY